jgi:hypothetical protein
MGSSKFMKVSLLKERYLYISLLAITNTGNPLNELEIGYITIIGLANCIKLNFFLVILLSTIPISVSEWNESNVSGTPI